MPKIAWIEAVVINAVEAVLSGGKMEDDRIECKATLPNVDKARQLAGSANSALGEYIIWIIGVDEGKHELVSLEGLADTADWYSQMTARFEDQVSPTLTRNLRAPDPQNVVYEFAYV